MRIQNIVNLPNLTLLVALALSTIAAYYSIIGLTAIYAGAFIPIIVMGTILEIGKITTTVWLRKYWHKAGWVLKAYLVPAVVALALLTSMGIFGFLSKAHMDQGITSGDVQAKLSLYDEKIKTQRDNIDLARKALQQMDAQVDARLSRGDSEAGAERAVQIRRQQQGERVKLQKEIADAQKEIARLNEERAPIAAENRKVEAEVGPIKYIAALIYGDNPDANLLERAVRWVTILLVLVFDPLAIALVLAANASKEWEKKAKDDNAAMSINPEPEGVTIRPFTEEEINALNNVDTVKEEVQEDKQHHPDTHPYLKQGFKYPENWEHEKPLVYHPEIEEEPKEEVIEEVVKGIENKLEIVRKLREPEPVVEPEITVDSVDTTTTADNNLETVTPKKPFEDSVDGYVIFEGKQVKKEALKEMRPDLFSLTADHARPVNTSFGTKFPEVANKGDMFVRVDALPNIVYKHDGNRWIQVNKEKTDTYLYNEKYIQYLINKLDQGEYDPDLLSDNEKTQVEYYLKHNKL